MCNTCIPVEQPPRVWELLATLTEDFALAVAGAPSDCVERAMLHANLHRIIIEFMDTYGGHENAAMALATYVERIERRAGLGEFSGKREPIPNWVRTIGSGHN